MRGMTAPKPRRRTIRFAIVAVVCLLLGAATTVGVAWGFTALTDPTSLTGSHWSWDEPPPAFAGGPSLDPEISDIFCSAGAGVRQFVIFRRAFPRAELESRLADPKGRSMGFVSDEHILQTGWPMHCLDSTFEVLGSPEELRAGHPVSVRQGIVAPASWRELHPYLPCRPLFPGFALDTALYAAAWYLLIFTPLPLIRAGRRRFRVSRGMCGSCGYDLKGSKVGPCPECGT